MHDMAADSYPKWASYPGDEQNLREVAPGLWVGAVDAVTAQPWHTIIDLYGTATDPFKRVRYANAQQVVSIPFADGDAIPEGALDRIHAALNQAQTPTLIHCQAGLSRSASDAYGMLRHRGKLSHDAALARVTTPGHGHQFPRPTTLASARAWVHARRR
jgi:protein-tyrosine phosphatase